MIIHGDCLEIMDAYPDNHFTSILTDPPYGLGFMGKEWDSTVPGEKYWSECLRVCKPGAMMLCFGGTRKYHRLTCAIENAGWEIRDCLMWLYGSGFPKSHNNFGLEGYGTALKPAWEPIILAMKPLDGTYAQNIEKWGIGGLNIDASRIEGKLWKSHFATGLAKNKFFSDGESKVIEKNPNSKGRWPANTLFDMESAEMLDVQSGIGKSAKGFCNAKKVNSCHKEAKGLHTTGREISWEGYGDSGGASRFFYCAKASPSEREGNNHPTVKPIKLLEYLLKLIAPPQNALILDPFAGSGSTCVAAKNLGLECVGIEINEDYCEIANARIKLGER